MGSLLSLPLSPWQLPQTRLLTSCRSCGSREGGGRGAAWDPPPRNRAEAAGWPHFLPAPSLVSWSHSRTAAHWKPCGLPRAGPGRGASPSCSEGPAVTQPRPPRQLFHPGRTQPSALCAPLIPTHFQLPLCSCCPTGPRTERFFFCWVVFVCLLFLTGRFCTSLSNSHLSPRPPIPAATLHAGEADSAVARIQIWV